MHALALQVLGTVKNAGVVWIGIIFLRELVTVLQVRQLLPASSSFIATSGHSTTGMTADM
jgi:hypothetical protein